MYRETLNITQFPSTSLLKCIKRFENNPLVHCINAQLNYLPRCYKLYFPLQTTSGRSCRKLEPILLIWKCIVSCPNWALLGRPIQCFRICLSLRETKLKCTEFHFGHLAIYSTLHKFESLSSKS